jgi:NDP-sugar pyrophosphorylase family protein
MTDVVQNIDRIEFFESIPEVLNSWFSDDKPVWFILNIIKEVIYAIASTSPDKYDKINKDVFVSKNVKKIDRCVEIYGPALIGDGCELRHGAFLRENVIIGNNCVIGNSVEIKNSVLFDNVEVPHFNYIGDSILGNYAHLGAGAKTANVLLLKNKKKLTEELQMSTELVKKSIMQRKVKIKMPNGEWVDTGLGKFGAIIGDYAEIGVNATMNPGTLLEKGVFVPSSVNIGGYFKNDFIFHRNIIYQSG